MVAGTPSWTEYGCPVSPQSSQGSTPAGYTGRSRTASSPTSSENSSYPSPALSPGDWNVASPSSAASSPYHRYVHSHNSSMNGSPNSAPAALDSTVSYRASSNKSPPNLPSNLGKNEGDIKPPGANKKVLESIKKEFLGKSSLDQDREKAANRRALALIKEATAVQYQIDKRAPRVQSCNKQSHSLGAPLAVVPQTPLVVCDGREKLATSSWKRKKAVAAEDFETVHDFKCQLDRDREQWAQKMALKLMAGKGVSRAA